MRPQTLNSEGGAGNEPASADRNDAGVKVGHLFHDLQTHGPLAGQNVGMVIPGDT